MIKLRNILSEIQLLRPGTPLKIGNKLVNKSTAAPTKPGEKPNKIETYGWEEGKKLLSTITRRNAERLFIKILGITPQWVKIETSPIVRKSFYIYGEYNGEPIMIARRETNSPAAGQTKLYSKYKVLQLHKAFNIFNDKENILKVLKINV